MKIKKLLLLLLIALMVVSFIGCKGGGGTDKTPEPTDTPAPTDTPEPTATPTPTPEPTPDPDEGVDAVLYRFALEGENIIDTMFEGNDINPTYAEAEFTEEGLHLTVVDFHDPIFNLPMPDGALDIHEYPIFKMIFKHTAGISDGEFYVACDGEAITGAGQHVKFNVDSGEDWQEVYLDFSELKPDKQTITEFRADILWNPPIDSTITIDFMGFFKTMEDAENYQPPNRR
ncbi:MAG: hypothetical protein ACOX3J_08405 [Clostridia bacterium]|jgi:hypothetical protein